MYCSDERCTGNHDRNVWADLCPRIKEAGHERNRRLYAEKPWAWHHERQLKNRRLRAVQRMQRRASG